MKSFLNYSSHLIFSYGRLSSRLQEKNLLWIYHASKVVTFLVVFVNKVHTLLILASFLYISIVKCAKGIHLFGLMIMSYTAFYLCLSYETYGHVPYIFSSLKTSSFYCLIWHFFKHLIRHCFLIDIVLSFGNYC